MSNNELIWQGPNGLKLPSTVKDAQDLVPFANHLSEKQRNQIISAFQIEAFDMAAEYAWKKSMVKLKETLSTLGMKFVGEMLGRDDFDETTEIDFQITDYAAIELAEKLGVIGATASLRLRQSNELITHFFSKNADEDLDYTTAFTIVKSSVQYILGESDISIALEFSKFRDRVLSETLHESDPQVEQIIDSPLFYLRTVITIIITSIKNDSGAKLENSLANLNLFVPKVWDRLAELDKWNIGTAYRDVTASGNSIAISGVKNALLKVNGFDYVPESLRSSTFIKTAQQLLDTHRSVDNFYREPPVARKLSTLGSTIPSPALVQCMQAYLAVYLGNFYGISWDAAHIAGSELSKITPDRWKYYFEKVIQTDDVILNKGTKDNIERFASLLHTNNLTNFTEMPSLNQEIYNAIIEVDLKTVKRISNIFLSKIKSIN